MPTEMTSILTAIEKQGERAERLSRDQMSAINGLASELRDFGSNISKAMHREPQTMMPKSNGTTWTLLFGVAALIFGLMAPMYIMISGLASGIVEHQHLPGHPITSQQLAAFEVNLKEIETQFKGINERITLEHRNQDAITETIVKQMDHDNEREERSIGSNAAQWERIRFIEHRLFGSNLHGIEIPKQGIGNEGEGIH